MRGIKEEGKENGIYGSFGKGLYPVPLSNKAMAKKYGNVYFLVNAKPKNPKIVSDLNSAEIFIQNLIQRFCEKNGKRYNRIFFEENTTIEEQVMEMGYDGFLIKGREMVAYKPENVVYFRNEEQLIRYYSTLHQ